MSLSHSGSIYVCTFHLGGASGAACARLYRIAPPHYSLRPGASTNGGPFSSPRPPNLHVLRNPLRLDHEHVSPGSKKAPRLLDGPVRRCAQPSHRLACAEFLFHC